MMPLSYHSSNVLLIPIETMLLLVLNCQSTIIFNRCLLFLLTKYHSEVILISSLFWGIKISLFIIFKQMIPSFLRTEMSFMISSILRFKMSVSKQSLYFWRRKKHLCYNPIKICFVISVAFPSVDKL